MELPSPLPLMSFSSSSSSSSSSSATSNIPTASALLKASLCDEPISASSPTNSITNQSQLDQYCSCMIPVYDTCPAGHGTKKRKVISLDQQGDEVAHGSTFPATLISLQSKVDHQLNCSDESTVKDKYQEEEGELAGCTTPPHWQSSACNAAHNRHDCKFKNDEPLMTNNDCIDFENDVKLPMANNNADLDPELSEYEQTFSAKSCTADDHKLGRRRIDHGGDGLERVESISTLSYKCGGLSCSNSRRGRVPPPPPRKPKATPRILKSSILNFFVPPDLELFFSSTSSTPATSTHHDGNMKQAY